MDQVDPNVMQTPWKYPNRLSMNLESNPSVEILRDEFERRRRVNPRYSQRSFAKHLGLAAGELSEVLSGKRKMSLKMGLRVARVLGMTTLEIREFIGRLNESQERGGRPAAKLNGAQFRFERMSTDIFHAISDWYCFAILSLAETKDFQWTPAWIACRLDVHVSDVKNAIQRLLRVGYLTLENGRLRASKEGVEWSEDIPVAAIKNFHRAQLNKAIHALEFQDISEREISGVGFAIDPDDLPKIKKEMSRFQDELIERFSKSKNRREVYQLEMALFRISVPDSKREKSK